MTGEVPQTQTVLRQQLPSILRALLRRPGLWPTAIEAAIATAPRRWWRQAPFLPIPDSTWMHFRTVTAYGGDGRFDADEPIRAEDVIVWLEWLKEFPSER